MRSRQQGEYFSVLSAARAYAKLAGYAGKGGGWIYRTTGEPGRVMCQGWDEFARICLRRGWVKSTGKAGGQPYVVPIAEEVK